MSEQDNGRVTTLKRPATNDKDAWKTYWNAQGWPWRTEPEIDAERQKYLAERRVIVPDIEKGTYPFKDVEPKLSRADIEWLLATHEKGEGPVNWDDESQRERIGLDLRGADLRKVDLHELPLTRTCAGLTWIRTISEWLNTTPEQREMARIHLEDANLSKAHLEGANPIKAYLEDSYMIGSHLENANLSGAYMAAYLIDAHLEDADLTWTHLERANLAGAHLERANLKGTFFDTMTNLERVSLGEKEKGFASIVDVRWGDVDLSVIPWWSITILGNERSVRNSLDSNGEKKTQETRLDGYTEAVRANHQLATVLRDQGLDEQADIFSYRAQLLQRKVFLQLAFKQDTKLWLRILRYGSYIFSWLLDLIAGYGYKASRSLLAYLLVIGVFTFAYYVFGQTVGPYFSPLGAVVFSITSFHGRGFFPGGIQLDDPITVMAALEAIAGLTIEVSLIATFTQRFFGK